MRQYLISGIVAIGLCAGLCYAYAAEQDGRADYVRAVRGSHL